jgi:hypothetical protein
MSEIIFEQEMISDTFRAQWLSSSSNTLASGLSLTLIAS